MARRPFPCEGIRFLDETPKASPAPEPATAPAVAPASKPRKKRGFPVGTLAFLTVVGLGIVGYKSSQREHSRSHAEDKIEQSFEVEPGATVLIDSIDGAVHVEAGEPGKVTCVVERRARAEDEETAKAALTGLVPTLAQTDDGVVLKVEKAEWYLPGWSGGATMRVAVPSDAAVKVVTRNGEVDVRGVQGEVDARSSNAPIRIHDAMGKVVAETTNGPINIEADDAVVDLKTSNGPIKLRGRLASGESRLATSNGGVEVRLPDDQAFRLEAVTTHGKVDSDFEIEGESKKNRITGTCGEEPETTLVVRTSNGNIEVEKLD